MAYQTNFPTGIKKGAVMQASTLTKEQVFKVLKVALYLGISAFLDALISFVSGNQFGVLTPVLNLILVTLKQVFTTK